MDTIFDFIFNALKITFSQIVTLLGLFFTFGFALHFLEKMTSTLMMKSFGWKSVYWTGWIGTSVHECGHALFCLLFGHRIDEMVLFDPDPVTGTLGYVIHSHQGKIYQRVGMFFIGAGPLILGPLVIYLAMRLLVPNSEEIISLIDISSYNFSLYGDIVFQLKVIGYLGTETVKLLFSIGNLYNFKFWIFLYISISVASHMGLSAADLKGMWSGLFLILGLLFLINLVTLMFGVNISHYLHYVTSRLGLITALFFLSLIMSLINLTGSFILVNTIGRIR